MPWPISRTNLPVRSNWNSRDAAVRHGARGADRDRRIAGARVDVDVAPRVGRHAGDFAQVDVVGHRQRARIRIELNRRNRLLRREQAAADGERGRDRENQCSSSCRSPYRAAADDVAGCIFDGLRMIFCARHAEISETNS